MAGRGLDNPKRFSNSQNSSSPGLGGRTDREVGFGSSRHGSNRFRRDAVPPPVADSQYARSSFDNNSLGSSGRDHRPLFQTGGYGLEDYEDEPPSYELGSEHMPQQSSYNVAFDLPPSPLPAHDSYLKSPLPQFGKTLRFSNFAPDSPAPESYEDYDSRSPPSVVAATSRRHGQEPAFRVAMETEFVKSPPARYDFPKSLLHNASIPSSQRNSPAPARRSPDSAPRRVTQSAPPRATRFAGSVEQSPKSSDTSSQLKAPARTPQRSPLRSGASTPRRERWTRDQSPGRGGMWEGSGAAWGNAHSFGFALSPMIGGELDLRRVRKMKKASDFYRGGAERQYHDESDYMFSPAPSTYNENNRWKDRDLSSVFDASRYQPRASAQTSMTASPISRLGSRRSDVDYSFTNSDGSYTSFHDGTSRKKKRYQNLERDGQWSPKAKGKPSKGGRRFANMDTSYSQKSDYSDDMSRGTMDQSMDRSLIHAEASVESRVSSDTEYMTENSEDGFEEDEDEEPVKAVGFFGLFRFADSLDYLLMLLGSLGAIVNGGSLPWYSLLFGDLVNTIATEKEISKMIDRVHQTCIFMVGLSLIVLVGTYLEVACWMLASDRQATRIRTKYLRAVLRQDISYFDLDVTTGEVMNSISSDVATIQDAIGEKVGNFIHHMSTFVSGYTVGCLKSWQVSLVVLAATPLMMICGQLQRAVYIDLASKEQGAYQEAGNLAAQAISAIRTVYSFAAEDGLTRQYSKLLEKTLPYGLRVGFARGAGIGTIYLVMYGTWALAMWYGSVLVARGSLTGGAAITTFFAVITGGKGLGLAAPYLANFAQGGVAAGRVFSIVKRAPLIDSDDFDGEIPATIHGDIFFRRVNFTYPARPDVQIFNDFSMRVTAGKTVALVGPSGSGKSTIFALLERFYDPDSGLVILDGLDIRDLQLQWLRRQIGMVGQEPVLYATTIAENILYGKENANQSDVVAAAEAANAHSFISKLPQGYNTQVGERGVQMSGGQKQRVAIARAVLKNPKILLLDEATSALDSESEKLVQDALDQMLVGRTTIVIAHRLSTIRDVDTIAVIQNGGVEEMGSHDQLYAKKGAYCALVNQTISGVAGDGKTNGLNSAYVTPETTPIHTMAAAVRTPVRTPGPAPLSPLKKHVLANNPDQEKKIIENDVSLSRLLKMSMEELPLLIVGLFNAIHAGLIFPFFGLIMGVVVSVYFLEDKAKMRREVDLWAGVYLGLGVAAIISMTGQHGFFNWAGIKLTKRVRELLLESLLRQEVGWFDRDENSSGAIIARLSVDSAFIRGMFGDRFSILAMGITAIGVGLVICLVLQWKMTIVSIAVTPFFIGASYAGAALHVGMTGRNDDYASASNIAADAVSNIRTVASFSSEDKIVALFRRALSVPLKKSFKRAQISGISLGISQCLMYASYTLTLWYGSILVQRGEASFDLVVKVFLILIMSSFSVGQISQMAPDSSKSAAAVRSVFSVIDRKPLVDANLNKASGRLEAIKGAIEFTKVDFSYPARPDISIFTAFSLKIKPGSTMAFVGASGSGKSTVISLLLRFYDPSRGKITLDGVDLRVLNGKWLRSQMALVGQEPVLFGTSIMENIAFGRENTTMAEIEIAARHASVHDFICSLSEGYHTQVGERGIQLSGGQKQRIAIARAIVRDPKIFMLDEATSALDTESEKKVQLALEKVVKGRTTLIVAHRLSTIRNADGIAVVMNGKVVELGNHERLMDKAGEYFNLVNTQTQVQQ